MNKNRRFWIVIFLQKYKCLELGARFNWIGIHWQAAPVRCCRPLKWKASRTASATPSNDHFEHSKALAIVNWSYVRRRFTRVYRHTPASYDSRRHGRRGKNVTGKATSSSSNDFRLKTTIHFLNTLSVYPWSRRLATCHYIPRSFLEHTFVFRGRLYIQTELCGANLADYRRHFGILREGELYLVMTNCVMVRICCERSTLREDRFEIYAVLGSRRGS